MELYSSCNNTHVVNVALILSPQNEPRPWPALFYCMARHAVHSYQEQMEHDLSLNETALTIAQACWYTNKSTCYEEFEHGNFALFVAITRKVGFGFEI